MKMWQTTKSLAGYMKDGVLRGVGYTVGHDIISAEWTAGAIPATLQLTQYYLKMNPASAKEAEQDALSMQEGNEALSEVYTYDGHTILKGYKYANMRYFIPFGWWANPIKSDASTVWPELNLKGYDPFVLGGKASWALTPAHIKLIQLQQKLDAARTPEKLTAYANQEGVVAPRPVVSETPVPERTRSVSNSVALDLPEATPYYSEEYQAKATYFDLDNSPMHFKGGEHLTFQISVSNVNRSFKVKIQLLPVGAFEGTATGSLEPIVLKPGTQNVTVIVPKSVNVRRIAVQFGKNDADGFLGGNMNAELSVLSIVRGDSGAKIIQPEPAPSPVATRSASTEGTSHTASGISPQKVPDKPYQAQGQKVTWVLMCADVQSITA